MKLAFVLPGGGACGRWQIGVLKYLYDMGVFPKINLVCGTSVGGLNTLMVGKYLNNFQAAVDLWSNIKSNKDVFNGMLQFNSFWDYVGMASQIFKTNQGKSILDPVGLYHLLDTNFGNMQLKDLLVPIIITTTDMSTGERLTFDSTKNPLYKCADLGKCTSAIPLAFPAYPEYVNNQLDLCVDGGLGRNVPIDCAISAGSTHIILIGTSPDAFPREEITNNVLSIAMRIEDIVMHAFEEDCWNSKENYEEKSKLNSVIYPPIKILDIYPQESTGSALNFSNVEQFAAGYNYAKDNLPQEVFTAFLSSIICPPSDRLTASGGVIS